MARLLRVPEISAGSTDAVLASWPLAENVPYAAAAVIASVETAKAVIDIEADEAGVILRRLVGEGASVTVGQPIALIGAVDEPVADLEETLRVHLGAPASPAAVAAVPEGADVPVPEGADVPVPERGAATVPDRGAATVPERGAATVPERGAATVPASHAPVGAAGTGNGQRPSATRQGAAERIFVSPLARRLARDAGLDLTSVSGTGPGGRIMRRDVEQAIVAAGAGSPGGPPRSPLPAAAGHTAVPHSRVRRAIAARLTESKQTVPHFYVAGTARAGKLLRLRAELNDGPGPVRVSVNDLVIKAVSRAHRLVPAMNVTWTPEAVLSYESVDVGVAIAGSRGLVTPVLRSVEQYTISALAAAVADFVERASAGRLQQRELEGGSTSVTNLGMFGVEQFSAIINPPQSSILAVGAVHDAPVVRKGRLRAGSVIQVTLSADHRAVDGTTAAEWMRAFTGLIEHPAQILA